MGMKNVEDEVLQGDSRMCDMVTRSRLFMDSWVRVGKEREWISVSRRRRWWTRCGIENVGFV
jgi:hypothetical protein